MRGWVRARNPLWVTGALATVIVVVHLLTRVIQIGDSRRSVTVAWQVLHGGTLDLSDVPAAQGLGGPPDLMHVGGHLVPFFPWPPMLLALPLVALFSLIDSSDNPFFLHPPWVGRIELATAAAVVAGTAVLLRRYQLDRDSSAAGRRTAMLTALAFAFGTSAWSIGSRALWQQTVSMAAIAGALVLCGRLEQRWRPGMAIGLGAVLGAALVCRPTDVVFVAAIALWCLVRWRRWAALAWPALGGALVLLPFLLISYWQYGTWLPAYYLPSRLSDPRHYGFFESLGVNMISPSRGLLIYDPILVVAVVGGVLALRRRTFTAFQAALWVTVLGQWIVIARYGSTGGYTYGPRLMLDVVPILMVLAAPVLHTWVNAPRRARWRGWGLVLTAMLLFSLAVHSAGAGLAAGQCWNVQPTSVDQQPERVWDWSDPQFLRPYFRLRQGYSLAQIRTGCLNPGG